LRGHHLLVFAIGTNPLAGESFRKADRTLKALGPLICLRELKGTGYFSGALLITMPASSTASNIYFFQIRSQFFFFTLRAEHGDAVGECGAGGDLLSAQLVCDVPVVITDY
jgi:hypothetical protein